jgi:uncharacterized membrane protein SpoIIM required for sporulation
MPQVVLMTPNELMKLRAEDWKRLEALVARRRGRGALSAAQVRQLGALYRAVNSDLALARRDFPDQRVTQYLNELLTRAHAYLYQEDVTDFRAGLGRFLALVPRVFRELGAFTLAAFLLFIIPGAISFRLAYLNPIQAAQVLGLEAERQTLAENETWTDIPVNQRPYASTFIMSNNIRVALIAYAGGVVFGGFTIYILIANGLVIGGVLGLAAAYGLLGSLLEFIVGHGVVELSVIFMAGGAGLRLGWALVNPGAYTRFDALILAARRALVVACAAVPLLIVAGLIEGFISPSALPAPIKVAVGVGSGALMYAYLLLVGRAAPASATFGPRVRYVR